MEGPVLASRVCTRFGWLRIPGALLGVIAALAALWTAAPASAKLPPDRALVNEYAGIEGAHLGVTLPGGAEHFITVIDSPKHSQVVHQYGKTFTAGALTDLAYNGSGSELLSATITIFRLAHSEGAAVTRGVIAHETFHVFEALLSGDRATQDAHAAWLVEGAATWVESELVPNDRVARDSWEEYLKLPSRALLARDYDGVGFFGHMVASHINPWTRFKAMLATTSDAAAYGAAGVTKTFLDDEASVFFRDPALGPEWDQKGRNVPSASAVRFKPVQVKASAKAIAPLVVKPYADGAYDLDIRGLPSTKTVLEVNVLKGNVRLRSTSGGSVDETDPAQVLLCSAAKGCSCPSRPNHYLKFQKGDLAITGGGGGGEVELVARAPCEVLLPAVSCTTLLPGFGPLIISVGGKPTSAESRKPDGTVDSGCAFLYNGVERTGAEGQSEFVGAIAPVVNVLRASTIAGAIKYFEIISASVGGSRPMIGDEAVLSTKESAGPMGVEYASTAIVRVHNVVANYALISTPGNDEASPSRSLQLLAAVAAKL